MIREASVVSGTEFLLHPTVIPHSREEKASFLRGKGLTQEEIEEAFRRVESRHGAQAGTTTAVAGAPGAAPVPQQPTVVYAPPPPPPEPQNSFLSTVLVPVSLALSAGASALYFYKTYVSPESPFPWDNLGGGAPAGLQPPPLFQDPTPAPGAQPLLPGQPQTQSQQQQQPVQPPTQNGIQTWSTFGLPGAPGTPAPGGLNGLAPSVTSAASDPQLKRSLEDQSMVLRDVLGSLKDVLSTLKDRDSSNSNSANGGVNLAAVLQNMQASSELKAELSAIKTLLLANLVRGNGTGAESMLNGSNMDVSQLVAALGNVSTPSSPIKSLAAAPEKEEAVVAVPETTAEPTAEETEANQRADAISKARSALTDMVKQCPADQDELLVAGCGLLLMFLRNLLKEPLNPRYRRVAKTNANFKKSLEPLVGYMQFFEAVGFEERGSQMELKQEWTENLETQVEDGWARAVIEDAVSNLETVREQRAEKAQPPQRSSPKETTTTASSPQIKATRPAKWQPPVSTGSAAAEPVQNPMPPPPPMPSNQGQAPAYPLSFSEVARMHAEGKRPDGIKEIPDTLSSDEPSKPTMAPLPKPWEKASASTPISKASASSPSSPAPFTMPNRPRNSFGASGSTVEIVELDEDSEAAHTERD